MIVTSVFMFFFFFSSRRRHTRFDCDWSSDVCSSDLSRMEAQPAGLADSGGRLLSRRFAIRGPAGAGTGGRSEERRVGKECRSRGSPDHLKKKIRKYLTIFVTRTQRIQMACLMSVRHI